MIVAGSPLCRPSCPDARMLRPIAFSASWLRWPGDLRSFGAADSTGSPSTHGVSSSGLHMPGAAHLANTASSVARASGSSSPRNSLIPSIPCLPSVRWRRRACSPSLGASPSWLSTYANRSAAWRSCVGPNPVASCAKWASACDRVPASTQSGRLAKNDRIIFTCSALMLPAACASAVLGNSGSSGSPGECRPRPQLFGLDEPATGLSRRDPEHYRKHIGP